MLNRKLPIAELVFGKFPQERKMLLALLIAAFCLTGRHYGSQWFDWVIAEGRLFDLRNLFPQSNLGSLMYWSFAQYLFLLIIPLVFLAKVRPSALSIFYWPGWDSFKIYTVLFALMLPLLFFVSQGAGFPEVYPFIRFHNQVFVWHDFVLWQVLYLIQFVAIEFFFRGFLLTGLLPLFGESVMAVSILPYVMIHFGKPFPEIAGALFAGWILARLALRSGSIVPGILLHYAVALTMDLLSL
jgi:membrane protease YdiL (CAAX protease family)